MNCTSREGLSLPAPPVRRSTDDTSDPLATREAGTFAVRRPRLRHVRCALLGLVSRSASPGAVRPLPEDAEVAVAVGLKRDPLTVRRPDRKPVLPPNVRRAGASCCQPARRSRRSPPCRRRCQRRSACRRERRADAGRRPAGDSAAPRRPFDRPGEIRLSRPRSRPGPGRNTSDPVLENAEMRRAGGGRGARLTPSTIGTGPPDHFQPAQVERDREEVPPSA